LPTPTTLANNQTAVPACRAADIRAGASTDRPSYTASMPVNVVIVVTNRGTHDCAFQNNYNDITITDQSGTTVYPTTGLGYPGCPNGVAAIPPTYKLGPGQSFDAGQASWDQRHHSCQGPDPGPRYPVGHYTASPTVYCSDGPVTHVTTAPFQLV
jgi:hypothetical protein